MPVNSNFTPGQVLTAAQLNAEFAQAAAASDLEQIQNGTSTDAGTLNGVEVLPLSRGSGLLQTGLSTVASFSIGAYQGYLATGSGAVPRPIVTKVRDFAVTPMDYGAAGDGTTDDSSAFLKLAALPSGTKIDGQGRTYLLAQPITFTNTVDAKLSVKAASTFPLKQYVLTFAGDHSVVDIDVDANNLPVGILITGNYSRGPGVRGKNLSGLPTATGGGIQSVCYIPTGTIGVTLDRVYGENLLVGTADNTSVPRVLSTGSVTATQIRSVAANNTVALWINQAGEVTVDAIYSYKCGNNGVYDIATGSDVKIGLAVFENDLGLNLQTIISEGRVWCGKLLNIDCYGYAGVDLGGELEIDEYLIDNRISGKVAQAIVSRASATTCNVTIGTLRMFASMPSAATGAALFQFYAGAIAKWRVNRIEAELTYQTGSTTLLLNQTTGANCGAFIGSMSIKLIDGTGSLTSATTFNWNFPNYDNPSYLGPVTLISSTGTLSVGNATQANMNSFAGMEIAQSSGVAVSTVSGTTPRIFYSTGIPTGGTYKRGDLIINKFAGLNSATAWVCIGAGTPGTWAPCARPVNRGTTAQRPSGLAFGDLGTLYLDNTLNANGKPIWWNGSIWVDSTGASA